MDSKTFFYKVVAMRNVQKEYFRSRSRSALNRCKALEAEVDAEIDRVNRIIGERERAEEARQGEIRMT